MQRLLIIKNFIIAALSFAPALVLAVEAPQVSVNGGQIVWPSIDAATINVHRGSGEYLESLPGDATSWSPSGPGDYFVVGADGGDWRNWGRSATVTLGQIALNFNPSETLRVENVRVEIYSSTAAEVFWNVPANSTARQFEITAIPSNDDVELLPSEFSTGRSWFSDNLAPGVEYNVTVFPFDDVGNDGVFDDVIFTMPGEFSVNNANNPVAITDDQTSLDIEPPSDFRVMVYSDTAAELFWTHTPAINNFPVEYRITNNAALLARTSGSSYFLSGLEPGVEYTIGIFASIPAGGGSEALSLRFTTGSTTSSSTGNLQTAAENTPSLANGVVVEGNTIRWPDDGWYQVQSAIDFTSLCQGGRECTVADGEYIVINLTNGLRTQVTVQGSESGGGSNPVNNNPAVPPLTTGVPGNATALGNLPPVQTVVPVDESVYQSLSPELQAVFSPDCLLADVFGSPIVCFRAENRQLSAASFDGTPSFSFTLPGNNTTNRIEGLQTTGVARFAIIANVTTEQTETRHEFSTFTNNGTFTETLPLFDNLTQASEASGRSRVAINVQREPLLSLGVFGNFSSANDDTRLVVAGNYYFLIDGGNPAQLTDWRHEGVVINSVFTNSVRSGEIQAAQFIPGALISDASQERLSREGNTVFLELLDQTHEFNMLDLHNQPPGFTNADQLIAGNIHQRITSIVPTFNHFNTDITGLNIGIAPQPALLPGVAACEPDTNVQPGQASMCVQRLEPVTTLCSLSGQYTDEITSERHFERGTGFWTVWTRTVDFDQCLVAGRPTFEGIYDGTTSIRRREGAARGGSLNETIATFTDVSFASSVVLPGNNARTVRNIDGTVRQSETIDNAVGQTNELQINLNRDENIRFILPSRGNPGLDDLRENSSTRISDYQFLRTEFISDTAPRLEQSGSLNVLFDNQTRFNYELSQSSGQGNNAPDVSMTVRQDNGAVLRVMPNDTISAENPAQALVAELQSAAGDTVSYAFPEEGLTIPWASVPR